MVLKALRAISLASLAMIPFRFLAEHWPWLRAMQPLKIFTKHGKMLGFDLK
jgi:hypothetical protein